MSGSVPSALEVTRMRHEIPPRSGVAFTIQKGQRLTVIDPQGEQVADLLAFNRNDPEEVISSGRTWTIWSSGTRLFAGLWTLVVGLVQRRSQSQSGRALLTF